MVVFTDGSCSGNPGPGGWAAVFSMKNGFKVFSGYELQTTNNRMEIYAVLRTLEIAKRNRLLSITIYSDSAIVVNAINSGWIKNWNKNGWKKSDGSDVKNLDLWKKLFEIMKDVDLSVIKVKGHSGDPLNEVADQSAVEMTKKAKNELLNQNN
jgi:ribonuclease HI